MRGRTRGGNAGLEEKGGGSGKEGERKTTDEERASCRRVRRLLGMKGERGGVRVGKEVQDRESRDTHSSAKWRRYEEEAEECTVGQLSDASVNSSRFTSRKEQQATHVPRHHILFHTHRRKRASALHHFVRAPVSPLTFSSISIFAAMTSAGCTLFLFLSTYPANSSRAS